MNKEFSNRYMAAKKAILEREFSKMNPMQRQAVFHTEGPLLILAGAGSGKTTVLVNRIANILRFGNAYESGAAPANLTEGELQMLEAYAQDGLMADPGAVEELIAVNPAKPWSILAITFTNKAAGELKDRLENMLGEGGRDIWASTFHSSCVRMLRRNCERIGYDKNFTIYDSDDSLRTIKACIKELGLSDKNFPPRAVLSQIGRSKDSLTTPDELYKSVAGDFRLEKSAELYRLYQKKLRAANALDFDDLLLETVRLLQTCSDIREYYQRKFRYILVDEYQDTNHVQYLFVSLLVGEKSNLCVVGDDDQSIYKFRGATIENILSFENQFKNAVTIRLEQNYRSTQCILDAANGIIRNNTGRKGKELWTENGKGDFVTVFTAADERGESAFIAETILEGVAKGNRYSDFAVLYRVNAQARNIETTFAKSGIPFRVVGGVRFFDRKEIKDACAYLAVLQNPNDTLRLRRIINEPKRGIGETTVELAQALADSRQISLYHILGEAQDYQQLKRAAAKLTEFFEMIEELRSLVNKVELPELLKAVLDKTGYARALEEQNDGEARDRLENLSELASSMQAYEQENEQATLAGYLEEVALISDIDNYDKASDSVVLMTVHSAKGLEFPVAFIAGMEEGIFPGMRDMDDPEELEESRRLAYVAVTRAKERLYITRAAERLLYGTTARNRLSRFVREIPEEVKEELKGADVMEVGVRRNEVSGGGAALPRSVKAASVGSQFAQKPAGGPAASYQVGEMVNHKAFGKGMVISARAMGNDTFLEVAFDAVGTKKLMAAFANLQKLQ